VPSTHFVASLATFLTHSSRLVHYPQPHPTSSPFPPSFNVPVLSLLSTLPTGFLYSVPCERSSHPPLRVATYNPELDFGFRTRLPFPCFIPFFLDRVETVSNGFKPQPPSPEFTDAARLPCCAHLIIWSRSPLFALFVGFAAFIFCRPPIIRLTLTAGWRVASISFLMYFFFRALKVRITPDVLFPRAFWLYFSLAMPVTHHSIWLPFANLVCGWV